MKFPIWLDIPGKYIEDFYGNVSVIVGIFSERLTDTLSGFSLCFLVKTDGKNVLLNSLPFFFYFFSLICVIFAC